MQTLACESDDARAEFLSLGAPPHIDVLLTRRESPALLVSAAHETERRDSPPRRHRSSAIFHSVAPLPAGAVQALCAALDDDSLRDDGSEGAGLAEAADEVLRAVEALLADASDAAEATLSAVTSGLLQAVLAKQLVQHEDRWAAAASAAVVLASALDATEAAAAAAAAGAAAAAAGAVAEGEGDHAGPAGSAQGTSGAAGIVGAGGEGSRGPGNPGDLAEAAAVAAAAAEGATAALLMAVASDPSGALAGLMAVADLPGSDEKDRSPDDGSQQQLGSESPPAGRQSGVCLGGEDSQAQHRGGGGGDGDSGGGGGMHKSCSKWALPGRALGGRGGGSSGDFERDRNGGLPQQPAASGRTRRGEGNDCEEGGRPPWGEPPVGAELLQVSNTTVAAGGGRRGQCGWDEEGPSAEAEAARSVLRALARRGLLLLS